MLSRSIYLFQALAIICLLNNLVFGANKNYFKQFYKCDFDEKPNKPKYCGGRISQDPSGSATTEPKFGDTDNVLVPNSVTTLGTTVTDVTSITRETGFLGSGSIIFDKPRCMIPWKEGPTEYNFCDSSFQCMPYYNADLTKYQCQRGNFMYGKTDQIARKYFAELQLPEVDFEEPGDYELRFWAYMWCWTCSFDLGDSVRVVLNDGQSDFLVAIADYTQISRTVLEWKKISFPFSIPNPLFNVKVSVRFERLKNDPGFISSLISAHFGIDEIEIFYLTDEPEPTPDPSMPTITTPPRTTTTRTTPPTTTKFSDTTKSLEPLKTEKNSLSVAVIIAICVAALAVFAGTIGGVVFYCYKIKKSSFHSNSVIIVSPNSNNPTSSYDDDLRKNYNNINDQLPRGIHQQRQQP